MTNRKIVIESQEAPKAIGPYSVAIRMGDFVFASGTLGMQRATGDLVPGGIEAETRQALTNLSRVLHAADTALSWVVKTTVFMRDLGEFNTMNAAYAEFFPQNPPARSTVQVTALPKGAAVEIEAIAWVPEGD